ncbi:MAG: hypothetical protein WBP85_02165, partial [Terracidiphilus sp.]
MPLQARFSFIFAAVLAVGVSAGARVQGQDANSQNPPAQPQSSTDQNNGQSSSQSQPAQGTNGQTSSTQTSYGVYTPLDPLARVRYDNRWDLSLGFAYDHMKAGPTLLQGSNLGGLDMDGSYWLGRHWAVE